MDGTMFPEYEHTRRWVWRPDKWCDNDESVVGKGAKEVRDALESLGIIYWYEPWEYELRRDEEGVVHGVCFDFWLPACSDRPETNIEVSTTKHPGKKLRKIRAVEDMYGIPTLFVNWQLARAIRHHPERLVEEIECMLLQRTEVTDLAIAG